MTPVAINSYIIKVVSHCNLNCTYCYEYNMGDESWRDMPRLMSLDVIARLVSSIREHTQTHGLDEIYVNLHGGEPLLYGKQRTRALLEAFHEGLPGVDIHWGVQTNGMLLDHEWVDLFDKFGFHLGLSIDGTQRVNDRFRIDHAGRGSYARVMAGAKHLATEQGSRIFSGCLTVIDPESDPIEVYDFLLGLGARAIDFLLPHGNWNNVPPSKRPDPMAVTPFADWLIPIFDQWFARDSAQIQLRTFEEIIEHVAGGPGRLETIGVQPVNLIVVAVNGDIEGVDTLKSIPGQQLLGLNVFKHSLDDVLVHPRFALRQSGVDQLGAICRACPLVDICGGGYLPHRWSAQGGFRNPSVFCADLALLIRHIRIRVRREVVRVCSNGPLAPAI